MVGVLVLVDQNVPEPAPVVLGDVRVVLQQLHRAHDQVVEIEGVRLAQASLVAVVRLGEHLLVRVGGLVGPGERRDEFVLQVADLRRQRPGRIPLRIKVELAAHQRHQPLGIVGVIDRERRLEPERLAVRAQDAHAHRVKRADPHRPCTRADELGHPLLHLAGGLVGKGDCEDLARTGTPLGQQVRHPAGKHAGLARAGAGHDQQRAAVVHDGRPLLRVEAVEQCGRIDRDPRPGPTLGLLDLLAREREQGVGVARHVARQPTCDHRQRLRPPSRARADASRQMSAS